MSNGSYLASQIDAEYRMKKKYEERKEDKKKEEEEQNSIK